MAVTIINGSTYRGHTCLRHSNGQPAPVWGVEAGVTPTASQGSHSRNPTSFEHDVNLTNAFDAANAVNLSNVCQLTDGYGYGIFYQSGMTEEFRLGRYNYSSLSISETIQTLDTYSGVLQSRMLIDGNGDWHFFYQDLTSNMGTNYATCYYTNKIGGSWNTRVQVVGASSQVSVFYSRMECFILYTGSVYVPAVILETTGSGGASIYRGNALNATSFSVQTFTGDYMYTVKTALMSDFSNDWAVLYDISVPSVVLKRHLSTALWSIWSSYDLGSIAVSGGSWFQTVLVGTNIYLFYYDGANNSGNLSYRIIDISNISSPSMGSPIYTSIPCVSSYFSRFNSAAYGIFEEEFTELGVSANRKRLEFVTRDGSNNCIWDYIQLAPNITQNTADANVFSSVNPDIEFTGDDLLNLDTLEYDIEVSSDKGDEYDFSNGDSYLSRDGNNDSVGQSFTGNGGRLVSVTFRMKKTGNPDGYIEARLREHTGVFGTSSQGSNLISQSITKMRATHLTTSDQDITFYFDETDVLVNGTNYFIEVWTNSGSVSNTMDVKMDSSSPTHPGNAAINDGGAVTTYSAYDVVFKIEEVKSDVIVSSSDIDIADFSNTVTGGDTHPFNDEEKIAFTVDDVLFDRYDVYNATIQMYSSSIVLLGQSFTGIGDDLTACSFWINKVGSPTGNVTAYLYAHTGTFGVNGTATGSPLATSTAIDISTLPTTRTKTKFSFPTPYTMTNGTKYVIVIGYSGGDSSNRLDVGEDGTDDTHEGNISFNNGSWTFSPDDLMFEVHVGSLTSGNNYYWRVKARSGQFTGWWSVIRSFSISVGNNVSKIKVGAWKDWAAAPQINIGGTWKTVTAIKINIGGIWKDVDITP